jgi:hypothetical protein
VTGRDDSGPGDRRRPLRKWGSRSGGGPVRPQRPRPEHPTDRIEPTRPLRRPAPPARGGYDDGYGPPPGGRYDDGYGPPPGDRYDGGPGPPPGDRYDDGYGPPPGGRYDGGPGRPVGGRWAGEGYRPGDGHPDGGYLAGAGGEEYREPGQRGDQRPGGGYAEPRGAGDAREGHGREGGRTGPGRDQQRFRDGRYGGPDGPAGRTAGRSYPDERGGQAGWRDEPGHRGEPGYRGERGERGYRDGPYDEPDGPASRTAGHSYPDERGGQAGWRDEPGHRGEQGYRGEQGERAGWRDGGDGRHPDQRDPRGRRQPPGVAAGRGGAGPDGAGPGGMGPGGMGPGGMGPGGAGPGWAGAAGAGPTQAVPKRLTVTRVAAARTSYLSRQLVRKVGAASRAQGASETGLTPLIWLNAVNMAADAMVAVCLAGTIFFSAATSQQRANVALYLLITMAPFALVAPVIGPLLDRLQHGRRWALGGTLLGRALLAYIMASNFHGLGLYPAAFGTLVLAKAYGVLRAAAVPRVMPHQMTLVSANARLSLFGIGAAAIAGALAGAIIKITGSYPLALWLTAGVFVAGAVLAVRLPRHVDSPERGTPPEPLTAGAGRRGRLALGHRVVPALRATAAVRALSGFLTLFMVFLIQSRLHGTAAAFELGAVVTAAGAGSMAGTAAGARLRLSRPDLVVLSAIGACAGMCVLAAVTYSIQSAVLLALVAGAANSLAKLALDAIIQREVPDHLTASAFARSETLLQLAWVFGGGLGIVLPTRGTVGFSVAAALLVAAFGYTLISRRAAAGAAAHPRRLGADGHPAG